MEQAEEKLAQAVDFVQRGQFAKALPLFREARGVFRRHGREVGVAMCDLNEGSALLKVGRPQEALPLFRDMLRRAGEVFPEIRWRGSGAWAGRRKR